MRFAVVSDVHANLAGFSAVLRDIKTKCPGVMMIDLGDLLDGGPCPREVLSLAYEHIQIFIQGNHELYQQKCAFNSSWERRSHELWKLVPFGVDLLGDRLATFLELQKFKYDLLPGVTLLHASLHSNSKMPSFFPEQGQTVFKIPDTIQLEARHFYFVGHSHYPGVHRDLEGNVWINTGSVGYPFLDAAGPFARSTWVEVQVLDVAPSNASSALSIAGSSHQKIEVSFHVVSYDREKLIADWIESNALEVGSPYSWAILSQALFNEDIVYPIFKYAKGRSRMDFESYFKTSVQQLDLRGRVRACLSSSHLRTQLDSIPDL